MTEKRCQISIRALSLSEIRFFPALHQTGHLGSEDAMENLARYIIRASFSQERMTYIPEESKVVYLSKDGKEEKAFDALEWLAAMCSHVPNKGQQMVRYVGFYSNVARGKRKMNDQDENSSLPFWNRGLKNRYRCI